MIFFGGFVLFAALLIQLIISLRISGKMIRGHDNLEQTSNKNADLVFLGSSRCWAHFDPHFFDSAFNMKSINLGVDGHSEVSMVITRLKDYLTRNKPPRFAIFNFDPFLSSGSETHNTNFVFKNDFARYSFFPKKKNLPVLNYFQFDLYEKYIPLYSVFKYKLLNDCLFSENTSNYIKNGYEVHDENWDTIKKPVTDIMKTFFLPKDQVPALTNSLDELNKLCANNNIKLLCIQTPVYKVIYDEEAFKNTRSICRTLGIPFIDANKENMRNNINFFYNSNHLNKKGVGEMNRFLSSDSLLVSFFHNRTYDRTFTFSNRNRMQ